MGFLDFLNTDSYKNEIKSKNDYIETICQKLEIANNALDKKEKDIQQLRADRDATATKYKESAQKNIELSERNRNLNSEVDRLIEKANNFKIEAERLYKELQTRELTLESELQSSLKTQIIDLKKEKSYLVEKGALLKNKYIDVISKYNALLEEYNVLKDNNNFLESKYNTLYNNLRQKNCLFKRENEHLSTGSPIHHAFLIREITNLKFELRKSERKYSELDERFNALWDEFTALEEVVDSKRTVLEETLKSNISAFPFLAGVISDYLTYEFEILAKKLDWGNNAERAKKVKSIREIRADAKAKIEEAKIATYQLEYLKTLFPAIDDILETDYNELSFSGSVLTEYDPIRNYISAEEWKSLPENRKNQLALDRYIESRKKTKWQIGRDYELYVGYKVMMEGYTVDFFGSYMGLEDLGRDLIAKKGGKALIIQCKYWSQKKEIHEKHIAQLYGTAVCYSLETKIPMQHIVPVLITNISLSETAKKFADYLSIKTIENFEINEFPRIKCNIGKDNLGSETKIYHLPMDQQYDSVKIDKKGEFWAFTVEEAEAAGFRRAFKWHGN